MKNDKDVHEVVERTKEPTSLPSKESFFAGKEDTA